MSIVEIKSELRQMRNLNRRSIANELTSKYKALFAQLPPLEEKVMCECYINGKSYSACGYKISYCERQVKRIVHSRKMGIHLFFMVVVSFLMDCYGSSP